MTGIKVNVFAFVLVALSVCARECYCKGFNCSIEMTAGEMQNTCNDHLMNIVLANVISSQDKINGLFDTNSNWSIGISFTFYGTIFDTIGPFNTTNPPPVRRFGQDNKALTIFIIPFVILAGFVLIVYMILRFSLCSAATKCTNTSRAPPPYSVSGLPLSSFN